jgi:hypothetical protein
MGQKPDCKRQCKNRKLNHTPRTVAIHEIFVGRGGDFFAFALNGCLPIADAVCPASQAHLRMHSTLVQRTIMIFNLLEKRAQSATLNANEHFRLKEE